MILKLLASCSTTSTFTLTFNHGQGNHVCPPLDIPLNCSHLLSLLQISVSTPPPPGP